MASDLVLELHDLHGTFFSLVGQILPKLVDLVLFGFQLLFLLLQHLVEGLDGLIGRISHFLALLVMGALQGDSLLLLPILCLFIHSVIPDSVDLGDDALFVIHEILELLVLNPEPSKLSLKLGVRVWSHSSRGDGLHLPLGDRACVARHRILVDIGEMLIDVLPLPLVVPEAPLFLLEVEFLLHFGKGLLEVAHLACPVAEYLAQVVLPLFKLGGLALCLHCLDPQLLDTVTHIHEFAAKFDFAHAPHLLVEFVLLLSLDAGLVETALGNHAVRAHLVVELFQLGPLISQIINDPSELGSLLNCEEHVLGRGELLLEAVELLLKLLNLYL